MRKLLLTALIAAASATAANAQLYFVGNFNSFDLATAVEVKANENGDYVFNYDGLQSFKFSTIKSLEWEGETGFNAGAYGCSGSITEPGTYAIEPWGEDQKLPWYGNWTVTVNSAMTQMTVTTTTPKPDGEVFFLRGSWDAGWAALPEYQFQLVEGSKYVVRDVVFAGGTTFKVADAGWATINYGGVSNMDPSKEYVLDFNSSGNCSMTGDGSFNGNVYFDLATATISFEKGAEPEIDKNLYIGYDGDLPANFNPETSVKFEHNDNEYTVTLPNGIQGEWFVWNGTFKYMFAPNYGQNIDALGTYDIWFFGDGAIKYNTTEALTVKVVVPEGAAESGSTIPATITLSEKKDGVESIATDNGEAEYFNLQGVRVANPENGVYIRRQGGKVTKVVK